MISVSQHPSIPAVRTATALLTGIGLREQGSHTCWFRELGSNQQQGSSGQASAGSPLPSLLALERTIQQRKADGQGSAGKSLPLLIQSNWDTSIGQWDT